MGRRRVANTPATKTQRQGDVPANGVGTVLILFKDSKLTKTVEQLLRRQKIVARSYSCHRQLLSTRLPNHPTCLVAGVSGCDQCGLPAYEELKSAGIYLPVVFLTKTTDVRLAVKAMRAGAEDLLPLPVARHDLLAAIRNALARSRLFLDSCSEDLILRQRLQLLTDREREIVRLVISGLLNKEIAAQLKLALVTVKVHRGKAMHKLGARTSAELARIARAVGIKASAGEAAAAPASRNSVSADPASRKSPARSRRGR
jgi:FixJ family two-component response regulator